MEVSGQLHAPAALPPGKAPRYPMDRRLGGPQSWSGRRGVEKNLALPGIEPRPSVMLDMIIIIIIIIIIISLLSLF
jgi:hypothetical protein